MIAVSDLENNSDRSEGTIHCNEIPQKLMLCKYHRGCERMLTGKNLDVLVLTYNRSDFLRIQLQSLCEQTLKDFKITVLNNCSTDNTLQVVEEVKEKYPNRDIHVVTNEKNLGNPGNFIRSQSIPTREYVAVFHDDDAVHPEYLELAMNLFHLHDDLALVCSASDTRYNVTCDNWPVGVNPEYFLYPKNDIYLQFLCSRPNFATDVYKTEVYKKAEYHPELYGKLHDICFVLDVAKYGSIAVSSTYGIRYRFHAGSDSQSYSTGPFRNEIVNVCAYIKLLIKDQCDLWAPILWNFMFFLYKWSKVNTYMTWEDFISDMEIDERVYAGKNTQLEPLFTERQIAEFSNCKIMDRRYNPKIIKEAGKAYSTYRHLYKK